MAQSNVGRKRSMNRRTFVAGAGAALVLGRTSHSAAGPEAGARITDYPFSLGVASGDPLPTAVVLWTRLAPAPTEGGGMPPLVYRVRWEVAEDPGMTRIVKRGTAKARPEHGHSVHVDVQGLTPDREYWYRFRVRNHLSRVARTRTAPSSGRRPSELMFGLVSCQRYNSGFYTAYDDLVAAGPDLVVHVGDYIYESGGGGVRTDPLPESVSLEQYRDRYALYKTDPSLTAAHEQAPWLFTWDDHEVENNYAGLTPEVGSATPDPAAFAARRAAAYKAYWEHMPFRLAPPTSADFAIHRRIRWGRLIDFLVLDTRQYRVDQCGEIGAPCDPDTAVSRPMLGAAQTWWLAVNLALSKADWTVLAQQVVFSKLDFAPGAAEVYNLDQWDGYQANRDQILSVMNAYRPKDNVVLTGDIHASGVSDLMADYRDPASAKLGAEFVGTSISSGGSDLLEAILPGLQAENPHLKWGDASKRGWVQHTVSASEWRADYRLVDDATVQGSPVQTATSWSLPRGGELTQV